MKFEEYGKIVSKEEYIIDLSIGGRVVNFCYAGYDKKTKYTEGELRIETTLTDNGDYKTIVQHKEKSTGKIMKIETNILNLINLHNYLILIEDRYSDNKLPMKVYSYDSSTDKTEDSYYVLINNDIKLGPISRNDSVYTDGRIVKIIEDETKAISSFIIFYNGGYRATDVTNDEDNLFINSRNIVFRDNKDPLIVELDNIRNFPGPLHEIANQLSSPLHITTSEGLDVYLEYTNFGLLLSSSDNLTRSEAVQYGDDVEDDKVSIFLSGHKLYNDEFDISRSLGDNLYVLEQFEIEKDNSYVIYDKLIYKIDDDKLEEFEKLLRETPEDDTILEELPDNLFDN